MAPLMVALAASIATAPSQASPACAADPFARQLPPELDLNESEPCSEQVKFGVEPPDPVSATRRSGVLRARMDSVVSEPVWPGLLGSVKMSWAALGGEPRTGLRAERAQVVAGGLMRLSDEWALQANTGRDLTAEITRTSFGGSWQPWGQGMVFAEWLSDDHGGEGRRIGARWWLMPKRLSLEVDARVDTGPVERQRYGLMLQLQP